MWDTDYNLLSRGSNRKGGSINTVSAVSALVIGMGLGIAAWELAKRTTSNGAGRKY